MDLPGHICLLLPFAWHQYQQAMNMNIQIRLLGSYPKTPEKKIK